MIVSPAFVCGPRDHIHHGQEWPGGQLLELVPQEVEITHQVVRQLRAECTGLTEAQVARLVEVSPHIIQDLYDGTIVVDLTTYFKIQEALERRRPTPRRLT